MIKRRKTSTTQQETFTKRSVQGVCYSNGG